MLTTKKSVNLFHVNFSEAFHKEWKIRVGKFNWFEVLMKKNYFLPDSSHFENDTKLNSFLIDPEYIKQNINTKNYKLNPDGSIDLDLTLYFRPQSYFYLGLIISGTALAGCIIYLVWAFVAGRNNRYENSEFVLKKLTI